MYGASQVDELFDGWRRQGMTKEQLIISCAAAEIGCTQLRKLTEKRRFPGGQGQAQLARVGADASMREVDLRHILCGFRRAHRSRLGLRPSPAARSKAQAQKQSTNQRTYDFSCHIILCYHIS